MQFIPHCRSRPGFYAHKPGNGGDDDDGDDDAYDDGGDGGVDAHTLKYD